MRNYKRKKKIRKQENTHSFKKLRTCSRNIELVQEKKNSLKKSRSRPRKRTRTKKVFFLERFLRRFSVEIVFSWASSFFLSKFFFSWTSACFLVFLLSFFFINSQPNGRWGPRESKRERDKASIIITTICNNCFFEEKLKEMRKKETIRDKNTFRPYLRPLIASRWQFYSCKRKCYSRD